MRYQIGDIVVKQSLVFGRQLIRVLTKTVNVNRRGRPGFTGVAVDMSGNEIRKDDPYGNMAWGFDHEVVKVHKKV